MLRVHHIFAIIVISAAPGLGGCGTYVPNIQEIPGRPGSEQLLVNAIVQSIHCEIKNAVTYVINQDKSLEKINGARTASWFDNWGAAGVLTLTVSEKTDVNPTTMWVPHPVKAMFSLVGGIEASTQATRVDTLNFYYNVKDLYAEPPCNAAQIGPHPAGSLLIHSDLKFRQFLADNILVIRTGGVNTLTKNGITHDVKFDILTSGNINPMWSLHTVSVNSKGTFLTTNRDRIHELSVTFGPTNPADKTLREF